MHIPAAVQSKEGRDCRKQMRSDTLRRVGHYGPLPIEMRSWNLKTKLTQLMLGSMLVCVFAACFGGQHIGPDRTYLGSAVVPPCSGENDAAAIRCGRTHDLSTSQGGMAGLGVSGGPASLYKLIASADSPEFATHVVIRGSVLPDSVRCSKWNLAKLPHWPDDMPFREDFRHLMCFGDVEVYEYLLGVGPATLTVAIGGENFTSPRIPAKAIMKRT